MVQSILFGVLFFNIGLVYLYFFVCCSKFLFPIFFSEDLLYRCVPSILLGEKVQLLFDFLNSSDTFQQALSDLYASWKEMILLCLLALGRTIFSIFSSPGPKDHVNYCHYFASIIVCSQSINVFTFQCSFQKLLNSWNVHNMVVTIVPIPI